jgi:hypothetical protein
MNTQTEKKKLDRLLGTVLRPSDVGVIGRTFDLMQIAEEEILAAGGRRGTPLWGTFMLMQPGVLVRYGDALYRSHCRELLARAATEKDTRPGTDAELCACFCKISLATPFQRDYALAYEEAFSRVMGTPLERVEREYSYTSAGDEIVADMRRRLAQGWRTFP